MAVFHHFRHNLKRLLFLGLGCPIAALLPGCKTPPPPPDGITPPVAVSQTKLPVKLDGQLTDAAWSQTPGFALQRLADAALPPREAARAQKDAAEPGIVKFLYDENALYVGILLGDSDLLHYGNRNQTDIVGAGDFITVILKAADAPGFWEFSVAPNGRRSSRFCPGRGVRQIPAFMPPEAKAVPGFQAEAAFCGTLNQMDDSDTSWSAELLIPRQVLQVHEIVFAPGNSWTVLVVRHNYAHKFSAVQYSTVPAFPGHDFNWCDYYAPVEFR